MSLPSASTKLTDIHRRSLELVDKAKAGHPFDDKDCEALSSAIASLCLVVQELVLESKKPAREMPVLPKRSY